MTKGNLKNITKKKCKKKNVKYYISERKLSG